MRVSPNVVIMTRQELHDLEQRAFTRGVERGKFEVGIGASERVARNCANWKDGICDDCGAQNQGCQITPDWACPHFKPRKP
jgi:hypothetical protein